MTTELQSGLAFLAEARACFSRAGKKLLVAETDALIKETELEAKWDGDVAEDRLTHVDGLAVEEKR